MCCIDRAFSHSMLADVDAGHIKDLRALTQCRRAVAMATYELLHAEAEL